MGNLTEDEERVKLYLDYLNVEMNILGILAAFCATAMGLIFSAVISAEKEFAKSLWEYGHWYFVAGTILMGLGALSFYRQRSGLAWYYGQISLSLHPARVVKYGTVELLKDADSWDTWWHYHCGFAFTCAAFAEYLLGIVAAITNPAIVSFKLTVLFTGAIAIVSIATLLLWRRRIQREDP